MYLSNEDVQDIVRLLDSLPYSEMRLETSGFALTLRRTSTGVWTQETRVAPGPRPGAAPNPPEPVQEAARDTPVEGAAAGNPPSASAATSGARATAEIRAPLLGTFYRAPQPGAPPFVDMGSRVDEETVVGIIETMKLMNPVHAGVRGTVTEICLDNAQFAEQDAVLMRVEPEDR